MWGMIPVAGAGTRIQPLAFSKELLPVGSRLDGEVEHCRDPYLGTLVNAWLARGGEARGVRAGEGYVDVGTLDGYREAIRLLRRRAATDGPAPSSFGGLR